ncbi:MAG: NAD-dependent epimerase/dehydratase family protein [Nitrospinota bacterium]|nr:NAD-dependent epimerase/dehydratase family protein [Nitrospinota bacterium]
MRALVTGGGGFLGRAIVKKLLERGDSVKVLGRRSYADLAALGVKTVQGDVADMQKVSEACASVDVVFHTAALASIWGKRDDFFSVNVAGTRNVINACFKHGIKKLVHTSSPSVVYDATDQLNIDESAPYPPQYLALYPETKAIAEREVIAANGKDRLLTVSLRPHLIWGPGDTNLIPRLIDRARNGNLMIVGDGKNIIDSVYIDNAAEAHLLAADRLTADSPVAGSSYFITQGEPLNCWGWINEILQGFDLPPVRKTIGYKTAYRIGGLMEIAYRLLGKTSEPRMTRFLASQLATSHTYNIGKANNELGYYPAVSVKEGMERLFKAGLPRHF